MMKTAGEFIQHSPRKPLLHIERFMPKINTKPQVVYAKHLTARDREDRTTPARPLWQLPVLQCRLFLAVLMLSCNVMAQESFASDSGYQMIKDVLYRDNDGLTDYMRERCRLDVYFPKSVEKYATVVWFHGGGLSAGNKSVPDGLKASGLAVIAVNYRLSPKVSSPAWIDDAAAAVAWTFKNIEKHGGSAEKIFVSGHSAGGYLTSMVGLDKRWLSRYEIDADRIAGLIPYSGHTITHFTVRKERGIDGKQPVVDKLAPLFHVRKSAPPLLLITGDRNLEMLGRYEENAYMWRMMQVVDHPDTKPMELDGYNHGQMAKPAHPLLIRFVDRICKQSSGSENPAR